MRGKTYSFAAAPGATSKPTPDSNMNASTGSQGETVIAMPTGSLAFGRCIYALEIDETFAENCISENCVGY